MDSRRRKLIVSYVLSLSAISVVLILSCVVLLGGSVAWFSNNEQVNAEGMSIGILQEDSLNIKSISIYKVGENNNTATLYEDPSAVEIQSILTLNQYDSVFEEKREHTPIIVKITLENFKDGMQESELTATIDLKDITGYTTTGNGQGILRPFISNFMKICCSVDPDLAEGDRTPAEYYPYARDILANAPAPSYAKTFVNYTGSGKTTSLGENKEDSLVFQLTKPAGQDTLDVYLLLCYDENLITRFIDDSEQGIGSVGELEGYFQWGSNITFSKDINRIDFAEVADAAE